MKRVPLIIHAYIPNHRERQTYNTYNKLIYLKSTFVFLLTL